ncbi:hypothetical protein [Chitinophaga arvensicola]|uniref:Peptidase MA superfamily protein n=1 Tax=Chitinophaga arvensicola TaxID=29529 RepID=A0A1I0S5T6_9BACT|nr:hypothetical protein [Chitinophaga arvensicola]SEW50539.1 hypothetical protein SAMN04488122_3868 [Chitinophaga arvensicola]
MYFRTVAIFILLLITTAANAQTDTTFIFRVNPQVMPLQNAADQQKLLESLHGFLITKNNDLYKNDYWLASDFVTYPAPYKDLYFIEMSEKYHDPFFYKPVLVGIQSLPSADSYLVKLAFISYGGNEAPVLRAIYSIVAVKTPVGFRFKQVLATRTARWQSKQLGEIKFVYPMVLSRALMIRTYGFNQSMATRFSVPAIAFTFYKCSDREEMYRIQGWDFEPRIMADTTGALAEAERRIIFSGNNSEWYPHEIVHLYLHKYAGTLNYIMSEGLPTYLGGSGEKTLAEHAKLLAAFYAAHPERSVTADVESGYDADRQSTVSYVVGGIISQLVDEKYGMKGIEKLLTAGKQYNDFYSSVKELLGVDKNGFNDFIRRQFALYDKK